MTEKKWVNLQTMENELAQAEVNIKKRVNLTLRQNQQLESVSQAVRERIYSSSQFRKVRKDGTQRLNLTLLCPMIHQDLAALEGKIDGVIYQAIREEVEQIQKTLSELITEVQAAKNAYKNVPEFKKELDLILQNFSDENRENARKSFINLKKVIHFCKQPTETTRKDLKYLKKLFAKKMPETVPPIFLAALKRVIPSLELPPTATYGDLFGWYDLQITDLEKEHGKKKIRKPNPARFTVPSGRRPSDAGSERHEEDVREYPSS